MSFSILCIYIHICIPHGNSDLKVSCNGRLSASLVLLSGSHNNVVCCFACVGPLHWRELGRNHSAAGLISSTFRLNLKMIENWKTLISFQQIMVLFGSLHIITPFSNASSSNPCRLAFALVRAFIVFHDAAHSSFFEKPEHNKTLGQVLQFFINYSLDEWNAVHNSHHAHFGSLIEKKHAKSKKGNKNNSIRFQFTF